MVPSQRQNMIAWLAARSDQPDYGKLIVYEFPKSDGRELTEEELRELGLTIGERVRFRRALAGQVICGREIVNAVLIVGGVAFEKAVHTASHSARTAPERHAPAFGSRCK
jgi:uncharacterized membrane protein (UPF0182 family)